MLNKPCLWCGSNGTSALRTGAENWVLLWYEITGLNNGFKRYAVAHRLRKYLYAMGCVLKVVAAGKILNYYAEWWL